VWERHCLRVVATKRQSGYHRALTHIQWLNVEKNEQNTPNAKITLNVIATSDAIV
jgi:hypothetical protein